MPSTTLDLRSALSAWLARRAGNGPHARGALDLLETAERLLASGDECPAADWHAYLDATGRPAYLEHLADSAARRRWAETTFGAIRHSGYSLRTLLEQRVTAHPDRVLFDDAREPDTSTWTYAQVARYTRTLAAVFLTAEPSPRVAIFSENCIDGACADMACLFHGILVSPINVHTDAETLT